ncbi:MAG: hypothetical protein JNM59_10105 [Hyphomonadaceae bacterium]|nr:hypothetical protein [Hyphomonadaceae bacterium]
MARWIFLIAGVYGVLLLTPALFRPPQGAPEFYYGFLGLALVWQFAFLVIARDPERHRPLMMIAVLEKLAFFATCLALYATGAMRIGPLFLGGMIDGALMALFAFAWVASKPKPT